MYCAGCGAFQGKPGSPVQCRGCNSSQLSPWCSGCGIKSCARERGLRYCLLCADFPCDKMQGFMDDPECPYHKDVPAAMARLSEIGLEAWSVEQDARWNCPTCGGRFDWFAKACPSCGAAVPGRSV